MAQFDENGMLMDAVIQGTDLAFKSKSGNIILANPSETLMATFQYVDSESINFTLIENMLDDITNPRIRGECPGCKKDSIIVTIRIGEKLTLIHRCSLCKHLWQ